MPDGARPLRYRALLVDLDGTLADSLGAMKAAYHAFLRGHGVAGSDEEFFSLIGPTLPEIVALLAKHHGIEGGADALLFEYERAIDAQYEGARPNPGARELLAFAKANGVRVAIVTSAQRAVAEAFCARHDLARFVDAIAAAQDAPDGKPSPRVYEAALAMLAVAPGDALAVEDAATGIAAARAAGVRVLALDPKGRGEFGGFAPDGLIARLDDAIAYLHGDA
ncbi:HAD family phosphatase [bacterium]|nr:HAD family phosphatase [bacterium]